jgi:hypothetical protein
MKGHKLTRREVLTSAGAAAIGAAAATLGGCASTVPTPDEPSAGPKSTTSTAIPSQAVSTNR